jgi:hypothetical protein
MPTVHRFSSLRLLLLLACTTAATACKKDLDSATGLEGQWKLTERLCFCPGSETPNETITLKDSTVVVYKNNVPVSRGTFRRVNTAILCGIASQLPALRFDYGGATPTTRTAGVQLDGNTLVLDYGSPCDDARDTYKRVE